jgi:hypothetical protein
VQSAHDQKEQRLTKPLLGHIKKFNGVAVKRIRNSATSQGSKARRRYQRDPVRSGLHRCDQRDRGGDSGVVKRHHFRGGDSTPAPRDGTGAGASDGTCSRAQSCAA